MTDAHNKMAETAMLAIDKKMAELKSLYGETESDWARGYYQGQYDALGKVRPIFWQIWQAKISR